MKINLSLDEQVQIIQSVLSNPEFYDEEQRVENGLKPYKKPKKEEDYE